MFTGPAIVPAVVVIAAVVNDRVERAAAFTVSVWLAVTVPLVNVIDGVPEDVSLK